MTDRELLEKAAKAAGYVIESFRSNGGAWCYPVDEQTDEDGDHPGLFPWHPIDDDGDALRLAVRLGIGLGFNQQDMTLTAYQPWPHDGYSEVDVHESCDADKLCAATRRAVVRAAAAMGEAMP